MQDKQNVPEEIFKIIPGKLDPVNHSRRILRKTPGMTKEIPEIIFGITNKTNGTS
jgi:hypothetical protein